MFTKHANTRFKERTFAHGKEFYKVKNTLEKYAFNLPIYEKVIVVYKNNLFFVIRANTIITTIFSHNQKYIRNKNPSYKFVDYDTINL